MTDTNLPIAFGGILAAGVIIDYGIKHFKTAIASGAAASGSSGGSPSSPAPSSRSGTPVAHGRFPAAVDPLPDSIASRLDQGIDGTGKTFLSPWTGKVVYATSSDPGWMGGGYIAIESAADPNLIYYLAEGIAPIVRQGATVTAGQRIATPVSNPYNQIVGNFEAGLAAPSNPRQPLAQVASDIQKVFGFASPSQMVDQFYNWLHLLSGSKLTATSTSNAGYP